MATPEPETPSPSGPVHGEDARETSGDAVAPASNPEPEAGGAPAGSTEDGPGRGAWRQIWGLVPWCWRVILDRMRAPSRGPGVYEVPLWFVLIAVLGFFAWLAAGPPLGEEASSEGAETGPDATIQGVAADTAALQRQLAEARSRIAALEQAREREHQRNDGTRNKARVEPAASQGQLPGMPPGLIDALGGRETEQGLLVTLGDAILSFPIGRANLPLAEVPALDRIASLLVQDPALTARIEGHTDSSGRAEVNLTLSQERADAVKQALVARGVSAERIEAVGYGETRPIADNGTRAGRDQNRRIEVYLLGGVR